MTTPCDQPILKLKKSVFALDHSRALVVEIEGVLDIVEERMSRFRTHLLEGLIVGHDLGSGSLSGR